MSSFPLTSDQQKRFLKLADDLAEAEASLATALSFLAAAEKEGEDAHAVAFIARQRVDSAREALLAAVTDGSTYTRYTAGSVA